MKFNRLLFAGILFFLLPFTSMAQSPGLTEISVGDSDVYNRARQENDRMMDPALQAVPVERIISANAYRNQALASPGSANKSAANPGQAVPISSIPWTERGPTNVGGRTRGLIFDLNDKANGYKKVFAGGVGGGLWMTTDITASPVSWTKINDFFDNIAISFIAQDPKNPNIIYAATGESFGVYTRGLGVWKSTDGGQTWSNLTSTHKFGYIGSVVVDNTGAIYIASHFYGVERSSDGGQTWTLVVGSGTTVHGADLELAANGDLYATTGDFTSGQVYYSSLAVNGADLGKTGTWTTITPNATGVITPADKDWLRIKLACAPGDASTVYGMFEGATTETNITSIQRYNSTSNTWTVATVPAETFSNNQAWYAQAIAVDPNDANTLLTGSLDAQRSTDGGTTWKQISWWTDAPVTSSFVHSDHQTYVFAPGSSARMLMGTDGGVSYSSDMRDSLPAFQTKNNGYNVTQFYSVASHPTNFNYFLAGAQDNGTQKFSKGGLNATAEISDGDGADVFIDQLDPSVQISSYIYNKHFLSTNGGQTFRQVYFNGNGSFINPSEYDSKSKALYSGNTSGSYFLWSNVPAGKVSDGVTVQPANFPHAMITAVTISPLKANRVYFGLNNGTIYVADSANNAQASAGYILSPSGTTSKTSVSCIAVDPASEDHLLVTYFNYGIVSIYETKNATAPTPLWTSVEGNLPDMPLRWALFYPGNASRAIIATELGVWSAAALSGASTTWAPTNTGLANTRVDMLKYRSGDQTLAAATYGRGLFTSTLPLVDRTDPTLTYAKPASPTYGGADLNASATSTSSSSPITYTSSNTAVGTIDAAGKFHILTAGTTTLTASQAGSTDHNAAIPSTQTLVVQPAVLTITAASFTKLYLDSLPVFTQTFSGFKNGDTTSSLTAITLPTTTAKSSSPAGTYPITPGTATDTNYTFITVNGTLTITKFPVPTISAVSAMTLIAGATENITGTNFTGTSAVSFGGTAASSFTVLSPTSISAVAGAGSGSVGDLTLTTPSGTATFKGISFVPVPVLTTPGMPDLQSGGSLVLSALPASGFVYQWFYNGIAIAGATSSTYTVSQSGSFTASISLNGLSQTSAATTVTMKFILPAENFSLINTSATCIGSNNGSIQITAVQNLPYIATVTGTGFTGTAPFTSSTTFGSLAAGTYTVCLTIPSQLSFQQCFTSIIEQPQDLSLVTAYDKVSRTLSIDLAGASTYVVTLNGIQSFTTLNHLDLALSHGTNTLTVSTDKLCQGTLSKRILVSDEEQVFPNPFTSVLNLDLGTTLLPVADIQLYSMDGTLVHTSRFLNQAGLVQLNLSVLDPGIYILKLRAGKDEKVFKLFKN